MFKKQATTGPATATERASPPPGGMRRELLAHFGLLVVAVILSGLAITGLAVVFVVRQQAQRQADEAAPVVMNLVTRLVHEKTAAPPEELRRLLSDLIRIPRVQYCRLELRGGDDRPPLVLEAQRAQDRAPAQRHLRAEIRDSDGEVTGSLEVGYGTAATPAVTGMLWTASGSVAIGSLAVFWLIYRQMRRRFQPLGFVRDNLLAYQRGAQNALELLTMQDAAGNLAAAWNGLIGSIHEMRQELDLHRCRKVVVESWQNVHSHSSQAILNALPIGIVRIDSDDRLVYANDSATRLLPLREPAEAPAALADRLKDPAVVETMLGLRQKIGGAGADCRLDHEGGHTVLRLASISLCPESDDLVVTAHDITQLKEAERSRDEFLAHITHELRTPLTNIRAYAETLNDDFFDDENTRRECYNVIMTETQRLVKLIENVLSVSQIEAGAARLTRVNLRVEESLRQAVQEVQATADAKSIELSLKIPSKVPLISGDCHRLHQVWMNLIGNAVKYTPAGESVGVTVEPDERVLRVRVADSGRGIAPEHHEKVFEKFFRVRDAAAEVEEGTGLGLPIAREIVRLHGGTVWVESQLGSGATFIVELPVAGSSEEPLGVADGASGDR